MHTIRAAALILTVGALLSASDAAALSAEQQYPYPKQAVYEALVAELPALGYKIADADPIVARVSVKTSMTAFSYGERLSMGVIEDGPGKSKLIFDGALKVSSNVFAKTRPMKHFDKITIGVSRRLQASGPPTP